MTTPSKALPPSLPAGCILRPRLESRLAQALERRLTTVTAPAGFGKSTLLAAWAREAPCAWYSLEARDASLPTLAAGLVAALRHRLPALPPELFPTTPSRQESGAAEQDRAETLAAHLSEALAPHLTDELALVLDDVHETKRGSAGARLIEALVRQSPPRLHLVIASRVQPPFPIERLRGRGEVFSLNADDLAFSHDEISDLLRAASVGGPGDLASTLHAMTGGWPAAVVLAMEALRGASPERISDVLEGIRRPGGHLFGYLAEEVFGREPAPVRSLLTRVALFPRFSIDLCDAIGIEGARKTITDLLRRGLFIQSAGGDWYGLHALVREFALQAYPLEPETAMDLHRRAATWFESHGYLEEAVRSLAFASDSAGLADLLTARGPELLSMGQLNYFLTSVAQLPETLRTPELELLAGEAYTIQGKYEEALQSLHRATPAGDRLPVGLAWRLARVYNDTRAYDESIRVFERADIDGSQPREEAFLLAGTSTARFLKGSPAEARAYAERALDAAKISRDPRALAASHGVSMLEALVRDPQAAAEHHRAAIAAAEQAHDALFALRIRTNWAVRLNAQGAYAEALEELDMALSQAELAGYPLYIALALNNRAGTRLHLGRLDEAIADFQRARTVNGQIGGHLELQLANLGMVFRERGDLALSRAACEEAWSTLASMQTTGIRSVVRMNLARVVAAEDPDRAGQLVEEAVVEARSFPLYLGEALIGAGWVALAREDREQAQAWGREAEEIARASGKPAELAESLEIQAFCKSDPAARIRQLREALSIWREIGNVLGEARSEFALACLAGGPLSRVEVERAERRLRSLGIRPAGAAGAAGLLGSLPRDQDRPIEIRTLGGFQVLRRGRQVTATDWQSKKARDLVKILISHRGRPVPRDVLMDALWPEEDPERVARRFSVALATARSVLDPDRRLPSEYFIAADDDAVRLDLAHAPLDVESFLHEAAAGFALQRQGRPEEAREALASAEASYAGDFLEEDPYSDWSTALREEARTTYITVARALAKAASDDGDHESATRYGLRILERDPYDEQAHLGLVSSLAAAGQHGEARRAYQTYVSSMGELDVEPAPFPAGNLNAA